MVKYQDGEERIVPTYKVEAVDTTGAEIHLMGH